ncbi:nucleotide exchange factor GrpE [Virgibacillus indicus]|uniref:Protein GrpE n=1 Tax=Virgibacillus indicus TaxID=2024554 RepID=A0A265NEN7_9BACI|nr:nucleotide exchange factor GrpE [Virgibacillus indicus]OZU89919.1 nucleotide exchange factor GrpE [Virgibacillus indicus]
MGEQEKDNVVEEELKSNSEEEIEIIDTEEAEGNSGEDDEAEALQKDIQSLQQEKEETYQRMLRLQAEFDNFKKRSQKEKEADRKYKSQDLVNELLPVMDNFERALKIEVTEATSSLIDGITMVYKQLQDALKSQGVEVIEAEGKEFDPNEHHAVMQIEDDEMESNIVAEELQKGYKLKDRVIRPAMVKVTK